MGEKLVRTRGIDALVCLLTAAASTSWIGSIESSAGSRKRTSAGGTTRLSRSLSMALGCEV